MLQLLIFFIPKHRLPKLYFISFRVYNPSNGLGVRAAMDNHVGTQVGKEHKLDIEALVDKHLHLQRHIGTPSVLKDETDGLVLRDLFEHPFAYISLYLLVDAARQSTEERYRGGANVVQLYTGMVYKGPGVVKDIKKDLISILKKENLKNISEAVGINA